MIFNIKLEEGDTMGSSMYFMRKHIPERTLAEAVNEFVEMITPLGIHIDYENEGELYLWKRSRPSGIRVYIDAAEPVSFPEPLGMHYRDVFFDAVYQFEHDEDYNTDILLLIAAAYWEKHPDAFLTGEAGVSWLYDKEDIDAVFAKPFDKDWLRTKSHITLSYSDLFGK